MKIATDASKRFNMNFSKTLIRHRERSEAIERRKPECGID